MTKVISGWPWGSTGRQSHAAKAVGPSRFFVNASLAALMLMFLAAGCTQDEEEQAQALFEREVAGNVFDTTPVRGAFRPLRYRRTGFEYKCSECHKSIEPPDRQNPILAEHAHIAEAFDHGMNTVCTNCHHPEQRNDYVDHDGSVISSENPARLCAKCHGPIYRDWQHGVHGRQNGYWDARQGERVKLLCIQCHDPHFPKFAPMTPDPPPIRSRLDLAGQPGNIEMH